jgi:polyisoprenoid-binding protein YceI
VRGLLRAVIGLGLPILLVLLVVQGVSWRPAPAPEPAGLDGTGPTGAPVELVGAPDGTWVPDDGSFLGYRVVEHYPQIRRPTEGVGRTPDVEGTVEIEDGVLTAVEVRGDLRTLESGHQNRDRAVQSRYLDTEQHPWAVFTLTEPLELRGVLAPGEPFAVDAHGRLAINGVEDEVAFPLEGRWDGDEAQLAGQLPIALSDWGVTPPEISGFVRVEDDAVIELELHLVRQR